MIPKSNRSILSLFSWKGSNLFLVSSKGWRLEGIEDSAFSFYGRDGFPLICCVGRGERKREEEEGPRKARAEARGAGKPEAWMEKGSGGRDGRQNKRRKRKRKKAVESKCTPEQKDRKRGRRTNPGKAKRKSKKKREGNSQKQEQNKRKESEKNGRETKNRKQRDRKRIGRNRQEMILSRLVDTFFSRISLTMPPAPKSHNTACVLPQEEPLHWQSRSSGYSSS